MDFRIKIPFEQTGRGALKAPVLKYFTEHRDTQMTYTKSASESGIYGQWLSQCTEQELLSFIDTNRERLLKGLEYKTLGPLLHEHLVYRNALYKLEILLRTANGNLSIDAADLWQDELKADLIYWRGKFEVATQRWHAEKGDFVKAGKRTPYF